MEKLTTKSQVRDFILGNPNYDYNTRTLNVCSFYDDSWSDRPRPGVYLELSYDGTENNGSFDKVNRLLERAGFPSVDELKKMFPQFDEDGSPDFAYYLSLWVGKKPIESKQTIPDRISVSVPQWWEVTKSDYHDFGGIKATLNEIGIQANFEEVGQTGFNYHALFWIGRKPNLVISKLTEKYNKVLDK